MRTINSAADRRRWGNALAAELGRLGWTLSFLARRASASGLKLTQRDVMAVQAGRPSPSWARAAIAEALGLDASELFAAAPPSEETS